MLYIMRHGKTDWNAMRKLQGRTDIPLNEEGRQMAEHARTEYADIHFDICYCWISYLGIKICICCSYYC